MSSDPYSRAEPERSDRDRPRPSRGPTALGAGSGPLLTLSIALRFLTGARSRVLNSTARAALAATALGAMAMVIAMAVMTGYTEDLQLKLIGLQGEIIASPLTGEARDSVDRRLEEVRALPAVERVGSITYGEGSLASPEVRDGVAVVLRGVDSPAATLAGLKTRGRARSDDGSPEAPDIHLGTELLETLRAEVGDPVRMVLLVLGENQPRFRYRTFRIASVFESGFAEFDSNWAVVEREQLLDLRGETQALELVEIELTDPGRTADTVRELEQMLGSSWLIQDWTTTNADLFTALALQKTMLFLVLGLIVLVSTFNVSSTIVVLIRERRQDIAVLGALGLSPRRLRNVFLLYGLMLGALGVAIGIATGAGLAWAATEMELIRFPPEIAEIYFIDSVPLRIRSVDLAWIALFSFATLLISSALPARRVARLTPTDALRGA